MILACNHIFKSFGETTILKDASFHINEGERVAMVGINGAGKTTMLRIIMGEYDADEGEVQKHNHRLSSPAAGVSFRSEHLRRTSGRQKRCDRSGPPDPAAGGKNEFSVRPGTGTDTESVPQASDNL